MANTDKSKNGDEVYIACPKCRWEPPDWALWSCLPVCGHAWNTFHTMGVCPKCAESFQDTQCLSCAEWSPHLDWYHSPQGETKKKEVKKSQPVNV